MKIRDVMTPNIEVATPTDTLRTAAQLMADLDFDALAVSENNRLIGVITGGDITMRVVAEGRDAEETTVRQAMSSDVLYCFENESVHDVSQKMGEWWVRRLPVVTRDKRLIGIVSLADLILQGTKTKSREHSRRSRGRSTRPARRARRAVAAA
jgi:CBS-domain-containing membrane protein